MQLIIYFIILQFVFLLDINLYKLKIAHNTE